MLLGINEALQAIPPRRAFGYALPVFPHSSGKFRCGANVKRAVAPVCHGCRPIRPWVQDCRVVANQMTWVPTEQVRPRGTKRCAVVSSVKAQINLDPMGRRPGWGAPARWRSCFWKANAAQPLVERLVLQYPELRGVIFAGPRQIRVPLCQRVDLRFEFERLGKRCPRPIEIALERQRPGERIRKKPIPRVCGTPLD